MSQQVGRRHGRTTGPGHWGQNEKTPLPDPPWGERGERRLCRWWGNRRWLPVWIT